MVILVIDNYDSFTYNLVQVLGDMGADPRVRRNDRITVEEAAEMRPAGVVLSPGPGRPEAAGVCCELIDKLSTWLPILGVCLGHQAIAATFGGNVIKTPRVVHGKTAPVHHDGSELFAGLPDPLTAARYHSLVVDRTRLPRALEVTAWTEDGLIMGLRHMDRSVFGVQFHPESIATSSGPELLENFVEICGSGPC